MPQTTPQSRRDDLLQLLRWCAPALLLGAAIRIAMEICMPYGYIQFDTADFLVTPFHLLTDHHYIIHSKKAFFTPTFFSIPFLLHIPALIFIPIAQHLLGLVQVVMVGALVRMWFPLWRWIIIPATLLVSMCPWQLWYEHTLMGEANYVFFLFLIALLGSIWARTPTWKNFAWFALSLFFLCGTRAEGKIMLLFGFALIPLVLWPRWKSILIALLAVVLLNALASRNGGGSHAFSLLYATLFEFTPDDIHSVPRVAPYVLPLRDQTIKDSQTMQIDLVALAKQINDQVQKYVLDHGGNPNKIKAPIIEIDRKLSMEILKRRPLDVILTPFAKFRDATDGWPSGEDFGPRPLLQRQLLAIRRFADSVKVLSKGLTGTEFDQQEMMDFIPTHYHPEQMAWFTRYEQAWSLASIALRLPDRPAAKPRWAHDFISMIPNPDTVTPGVPIYFFIAWAGMLAAMFIRTPLRWTQTLWIGAVLITWYGATMVGVTNARFRFAYEPIFYIYMLAAIVWAGWGISRLVGSRKAKANQPGEPACTA